MDSLSANVDAESVWMDLKNPPNDVDEYYAKTITRILEKREKERDLARLILVWVTFSGRPLTAIELRHALAVRSGDTILNVEKLPIQKSLLDVCAGLVVHEVESNLIRLVHETANTYLATQLKHDCLATHPKLQNCLKPFIAFDAQVEHTRTCLTYLNFKAFESGSCFQYEDLEERLCKNPLLDYAARNWYINARVKDEEVAMASVDMVVSFLRNTSKVMCAEQVRQDYLDRYSEQRLFSTTGIHVAASLGMDIVLGRLLEVESQADVRDSRDRTPLSWAAENGHLKVVKLLLKKRVDINVKDKNGTTALHWAAGEGHKAVMLLLLQQKGADIEMKEDGDGTPQQKGADIEIKEKGGGTPLARAIENGSEAIVNLLLEEGANVDYIYIPFVSEPDPN